MRNKHRGELLMAVAFVIPFFLISFAAAVVPSFNGRVLSYFDRLNDVQQEKLYLHFDKPYYSAGERMWFKGYLLNAATHRPTLSNFIYVELIDRKGKAVMRKKIKRTDSLGFGGYLTLPPEFPAEQYTVRAYTTWMRNFDPDFYFSRNFEIGNAVANKILSEIAYDTTDAGQVTATIRFSDATGTPYANTHIQTALLDSTGRRTREGFRTTDENGSVELKLGKMQSPVNNPYLEVAFNGESYEYTCQFFLPHWGNDYALTFFPEGGELVSGIDQVVAFKAQHENGFGEQVSGTVYNNRGDTLTQFNTLYDGMGYFNLIPQKGETYYVRSRSSKGVEKRFDLPQTQDSGFSLAALVNNGSVLYRVSASDSMLWNTADTLRLLVHTRGIPVYLRSVTPAESAGILNTDSLSEGISHLLLLNAAGLPLCERLVFVRHARPSVNWQVEPDKAQYGKRAKVALSIALTDTAGHLLAGDFSLSVTDKNTVAPDSLTDNIVSNLLLTSDIKGYVDRPGAYFLNHNRKTRMMLDLVMLTHGWRRFNLKSIDDTARAKINYFIEQGQYFTGNIKRGLIGGVPKEGIVNLLIPDQKLFSQTTVCPDGTFLVSGIDYQDSAKVLFQGRTRKGGGHVFTTVDPETYPAILLKIPYKIGRLILSDQYMKDMRDKYFIEGGTPVYNLKEVSVSAARSSVHSSGYKGLNDYSTTGAELKEKHIPHLYNALLRLPGVLLQHDGTVKIFNKPAAVFLDDMEIDVADLSWLEGIPIDDVNNIEVIKDESSMAFVHTNDPKAKSAILVYLKKIYKQEPRSSLGFTQVFSLGYNKCIDFYSPVYDTPEKRQDDKADFRSTVYWAPKLKADSTGRMQVEFYTSDRPENYRITIEGVTENGEICRYDKDL